MQWFLNVLHNYTGFRGRARRMEFWMFNLISAIIYLIFLLIEKILHLSTLLTDVYSLAILLPSIAVLLRRLHDTGKSSWWALIFFVPLVGPIILLVFLLQDSQDRENLYGNNPKSLNI